MAEISLEGKSAIVTGAGRGMGRAMALALARAGAGVVAVDVDAEPVESLAKEGGNLKLKGIGADVTKDEAKIVETCKKEFGSVDILINNAGIGMATIRPDYPTKPLDPLEIEAHHLLRFHAVHSVAPLRMSAAAYPEMKKKGWGRIVTVTTDFSVMVRASFTAYGGAKAASEAYMAGLARQLRDTGISVNCVTPGGMVDTRMVPDRPNMVRERDLLRPDNMNNAILWLVSDASNGVTGHRMNARLWNPKLPTSAAAINALAPIAWSPLDP